MATQKINLTRDQLATFLKNQEQIKQFEKMFEIVDEVAPSSDTTGISIQAGTAQATANDALDGINRIANSLELLALAPVRNNVELAHDVNGILPYANQTARVRSNQVLTWLSM